jgi:hypothetical protein
VGDEIRLVVEPAVASDGSTGSDQPDNPVDSNALLVSENDGVALGWVPSALIDYVRTVRHLGEPQLVVEHMNGPDVPPAYRLLVTLTGRVARLSRFPPRALTASRRAGTLAPAPRRARHALPGSPTGPCCSSVGDRSGR